MAKLPKLDDAYALTDPDAVRDLYADWAQTYDAGFSQAEGYQLPREVALAFVAAGGTGPVLDFGAGTGLVADELAGLGVTDMDAVDLSADMLEVARAKRVYRDLYCADVLGDDHGLPGGTYNGVVSAGTFTLGHVGPDGLAPLVSLVQPGAVFAISVNTRHYVAASFDAALSDLDPSIDDLRQREVRIYDDRAQEKHRDDTAIIVTFRTR